LGKNFDILLFQVINFWIFFTSQRHIHLGQVLEAMGEMCFEFFQVPSGCIDSDVMTWMIILISGISEDMRLPFTSCTYYIEKWILRWDCSISLQAAKGLKNRNERLGDLEVACISCTYWLQPRGTGLAPGSYMLRFGDSWLWYASEPPRIRMQRESHKKYKTGDWLLLQSHRMHWILIIYVTDI